MGRTLQKIMLTALLSCSMAFSQAADKTGSSGQDPVKASASEMAEKTSKTSAPVYVPPRRGAPLARVGGGTRGVGDTQPFVAVITPEHTGLTSSAQPSLYWYVSEVVEARFEFALINDNEIDPIIEVVSDKTVSKGLNSLDLADHGVKLVPGVAYQWSVALVGDVDSRASDIVSSGQIEYVELTDEQQAKQSSVSDKVGFYAGEGYWYDLFASLEEQIAASPDDAGLLQQRAALLEQVGLDEVSAGVN